MLMHNGKGFIEGDDGCLVSYYAEGKDVYRDGVCVGYVESIGDDEVAYEVREDGFPVLLGKIYWSHQR